MFKASVTGGRGGRAGIGSCLVSPTPSLGEDSVSALRVLCHIGQLLMEGPLGH